MIFVVSARRTKQENRGLSGQPWGNPSSCQRCCGFLSSSKYHDLHGFDVRRSKIGTSGLVESSSSRIRRASVRDTLLNMFVRSNKSKLLLGGWLLLVLSVPVLLCLLMNFLTAAAVVWATTSTPPGIWIPYCPPWRRIGDMSSVTCTSAVLAATRRIAVPMPMGRSFSRLDRSLCSARK